MAKKYAVLYGDYGVKNFNKLDRAKQYAKSKVTGNKYKSVDIDKITTYPKAKRGQVDFSQSSYANVSKSKGGKVKYKKY